MENPRRKQTYELYGLDHQTFLAPKATSWCFCKLGIGSGAPPQLPQEGEPVPTGHWTRQMAADTPS